MATNGLLLEVRSQWGGTELSVDHAAAVTTLFVESAGTLSEGSDVWVQGSGPYTVVGVDQDAGSVTLQDGLDAAYEEGSPIVPDSGGQPEKVWVAEVMLPDARQPIEVPLTIHDLAVMPEGAYDPPWSILLTDDLASVEDVNHPPVIDPSLLNDFQPSMQFTDDGRWPDRKGWAIDPNTGMRFTLRTGGRDAATGTYALWLERWTPAGELDLDAYIEDEDVVPVYVKKPLKGDVAWVNGVLVIMFYGSPIVQMRSPYTLEIYPATEDWYWFFGSGIKSAAIASDNSGGSTSPGFPFSAAQARNDLGKIRRGTHTPGALLLTESDQIVGDLEFRRNLAHFGFREDIEPGAWQAASVHAGARVYVFDDAGDPIPEEHWSTGATAGLVGIGIDGNNEFYSMDRAGVEWRGAATNDSEASDGGSRIEDLRQSLTVTAISGVATVEHDRGIEPTGVVASSVSNARRATWAIPPTTDDVIAFDIRNNSDNSTYDGDTIISFIAWWD
jgi:hypothetical protein